MSREMSDRFVVLRDEGLNCAELGENAPGGEIFEAILANLTHLGETDPGLDLSLHDALSRRLAWGESPSTVAVDCDSVCTRLIDATLRSFPDPGDATQVISVITNPAPPTARLPR